MRHIFQLLIANGEDVYLKYGFGKTLLESRRKAKISELLRKHGAKTGEELETAGKINQPTPPLERLRIVAPNNAIL